MDLYTNPDAPCSDPFGTTSTAAHPRHTVAEIVSLPCMPVFYVGVCGCGWESIGQDTVREAVTEVRAHIATM